MHLSQVMDQRPSQCFEFSTMNDGQVKAKLDQSHYKCMVERVLHLIGETITIPLSFLLLQSEITAHPCLQES